MTTLKFNAEGTHIVCQSAEKLLEIFRVRSQEEIVAKLEKKERKKKQKAKLKGEAAKDEEEEGDDDGDDKVTPDLMLSTVATIRPAAKVRSFAFSPSDSDKSFKILVALHNNTIEVYTVEHTLKPVNVAETCSLDIPGHRSDVRTVAVSSDDQIFLSASNSTTLPPSLSFYFITFLVYWCL